MSEPVLAVEDLSVDYRIGAGSFHALQGVSFELAPQRVLGIVGETGCGKSTLAASIPRLLPEPPAHILSGTIRFQGTDLLKVPRWKMPQVRGTGIGMIFQEPINSLNPAYRVYDQIVEAVVIRRRREELGSSARIVPPTPFDYSRRPSPEVSSVLTSAITPHVPDTVKRRVRGRTSKELKDEVVKFLEMVRITDPETILDLYPHELSGGMRQRIMIAMALSERPSLLIADEPTSALDVTIQAQVLSLMKDLMHEVQTSILFISHDLGVIAEMADDVGVMYAGHLVELGPVESIFQRPRHPYTVALLRASPDHYKDDGPLASIPGAVPNLSRLPTGCPFHPRCALARPVCAEPPSPPLAPTDEGQEAGDHRSACLFWNEVTPP
ncbi:MAG: oligopeptide/dipeptide ABC transporter ATP-binding protein [Thermoplasmata archaeon]